MAKLYFKYGCMGASKSANALMTKFNYEEKGKTVWLIKPGTDKRDGVDIIKSRIGLKAKATILSEDASIRTEFVKFEKSNFSEIRVIICDEAQFLTPKQVEELRFIVDEYDIPVLCYGLKTDFSTKLFPGSKRLLELADSVSEIKTICRCGNKAIINARIDENGHVITDGEQILLGGNESYESMCSNCFKTSIQSK